MIGLNIGAHDSSICYLEIENNQLKDITVALEERFSKIRYTGFFPIRAITAMLQYKNIDPNKDNVAANAFGPNPITWEEDFCSRYNYKEILERLELRNLSHFYNPAIDFFSHHIAHAYSVLAQNPFEESLILVVDGSGNDFNLLERKDDLVPINVANEKINNKTRETMSVFYQKGKKLEPILKSFNNFISDTVDGHCLKRSVGALYQSAAFRIFNNSKYAGKVMGLASYGQPIPNYDVINELKEYYFKHEFDPNYRVDLNSASKEEFTELSNLAATYQEHFENEMLSFIKLAKRKLPQVKNLTIVGGCALNCVFNAKLSNMGLFENIFIPAYPNDEGISLGCAYGLALRKDAVNYKTKPIDEIHGFFGIEYPERNKKKIPELFKDYKVKELKGHSEVVEKLKDGEVIAVFRGRSECGPRALGHRSILALPNRADLKDYLNQNIKFRENFRPYGLMILKEYSDQYFEIPKNIHSPFMSFAPKVRSKYREQIQATVHIDNTCRIQTVSPKVDSWIHDLLTQLHKDTGIPALLNTSLNINRQPILETYKDALAFFKDSKIQTLILEDFIITK